MGKIFLILLLTFSNFAFAQKKSSNNDLREKSEIFHIKELSNKNVTFYRLETSNSGEFSLSKVGGEHNKILKVDTGYANKIDEKFSDHFISMKYMMKKTKLKKCVDVYQLSMRGETFNICSGDKARVDIMAKFVTSLMSQFN